MPIVQAPDGKIIEFPDTMKTEEINSIMAKQYPSKPTAPQTPTDKTPEWAGKYPNLYGMYGAGRALLRTGIEAAGTTGGAAVGGLVPVPGATLALAGAGYAGSKRVADYILDEKSDNSLSGIGKDVAIGSVMQGAGNIIGKIPGVKQILSPEAANAGKVPVVSGMMDKAASTVAEKTLKVPPSGVIGGVKVNREQAVKTMLDNDIRVTKGGLERVKGIMDDLGDKMDTAIASNPNAIIKTDDVLGPVNELKNFASNTVNGKSFARKIDKVISDFKKQHGDEITVEQAQAIKKNTNAFLRKSYGELKPVTEEATKQIVRGLKDRIVQEIPEIAEINLKYGEMANLERVLERAVNRTGNWDWFSLSAGMAGSIVGGATGNVVKAGEAVGAWRLLKSPVVQSQIAFMLKKAGKGKEANAMANTITNSVYHKMFPNADLPE